MDRTHEAWIKKNTEVSTAPNTLVETSLDEA